MSNFSQPLTIHTGHYAANKSLPAHADQRSRISIVLAGQLRECVGRSEQFARPGSMVIKPGHVVHHNQFGPLGARTLSIELPSWLSADQPYRVLDQWQWFHGGPLSTQACRLWFAIKNRPDNQAQWCDLLIELVASAHQAEGHAQGAPPIWLKRVHQELRDTDPSGSHLTKLATSAGVHPVYLARQFRHYFGCSVTDYVQAMRLSAALEQMATGKADLAAVALAAGFADQSHLSRAFQRRLRLTPAGCRGLLA